MYRCKFRGHTYAIVLTLIGASAALIPSSSVIVDGSRISVQQRQADRVVGHQVDASNIGGDSRWCKTSEVSATIEARLIQLISNWADAACIGSGERLSSLQELRGISIPEKAERPIGYSALDDCTPIFIDRAGTHSEADVPPASNIVMEGFYEQTETGGRIELNLKALVNKDEAYWAVVLGHEELHGVLEWLDPIHLNGASLPKDIIARARAQLRDLGYEDDEIDGEVLPHLMTHDPGGTGLSGVAEEDRVITGAMRRLLAESQANPKLKRVYWQLQRSHALMHDIMSGNAGIASLMRSSGQCPK